MIEPELTFFEVQVEPARPNASPLRQPCFRRAPEAFNAIDVDATPPSELLGAVQAPMMLTIAHIDQAIIAAPAIRMNDAPAIDPSSQNGLQRRLARIRHDLRVDLPVAFQDPEHDGFGAGSPAAFAFDTARTNVRLIDLHPSTPGRRLLTDPGDPLPQGEEVAIDRIAIESGKGRHFRGFQVEREQADQLPKPSTRNVRMMDVATFPRHDCVV